METGSFYIYVETTTSCSAKNICTYVVYTTKRVTLSLFSLVVVRQGYIYGRIEEESRSITS